MDIRKIIKESIDDFDWIRNIPVIDLTSPWVIIYDTMEEDREAQEWLFSQGWGWNFPEDSTISRNEVIHGSLNNPKGYLYHETILKYGDKQHPKSFDGYTGQYGEKLPNHTVYKWSDIKNSVIKESDEFDWIKGVELQIPITQLKPGDSFRIATPPSHFVSPIESEFGLDIYDKVFELDSIDGESGGPFQIHRVTGPFDYDIYGDIRVWLRLKDDEDPDNNGLWVPAQGFNVYKI